MSDKAEDNRHLDIVLVSQTIANHYEEFRIGQDITFMHEALRQMYDRAFATGYTAAQADTEAKVRAMREAIQDHMNRPDYWDGLRKAMEER